MADISYNITARIDKDYLNSSFSATNVTANMTEVGLQSMTYTLTTNAVTLATAGLSSVGMAFLRYLSTATASTAQVGVNSGGSFVSFTTLRAGEPAVLRLTGGRDYQVIGTSGTRIRVDIAEG